MSPLQSKVATAIDADLIRQKRAGQSTDIRSLDPEALAAAAIQATADGMCAEGFVHPARWLRSQIVVKT